LPRPPPEDILEERNLLSGEQDERLFEFNPLGFGVGDKMKRNKFMVETHAFSNLDFIPNSTVLLYGDNTLLSDLLYGSGDEVGDVDITVG